MKLLVTGGAGHIGSYLIRELGNQLSITEITIIDNFNSTSIQSILNLDTTYPLRLIEKDLSEVNNKTFHNDYKFDYLIHLAAMTNSTRIQSNPKKYSNYNLELTKKSVEIANFFKIPIIFPSSTSVYGNGGISINELSDLGIPKSEYSIEKIKEEKYIQDNIDVTYGSIILRLGSIYGTSPGMKFHTAINKFCFEAATTGRIKIWETALNQIRPYLSITELVRTISILTKEKNKSLAIYNLASDHLSAIQIIGLIEKNLSKNIIVEKEQSEIMNSFDIIVDCKKIENLGLYLMSTVEKDIANTVNLFRNIHYHV